MLVFSRTVEIEARGQDVRAPDERGRSATIAARTADAARDPGVHRRERRNAAAGSIAHAGAETGSPFENGVRAIPD